MSEVSAVPDICTVLCVDDQPNILAALRRLFRGTDYHVLTAGSGQEGLAILVQHSVDVVISDMRMPEMDGARFLEAVRNGWPQVLRILLTGYADVESTMAAINRGEIYRYICKPWDDNELLLVMREARERLGLVREKDRLEQLTRAQNATLAGLNQQLGELNHTLEERVRARAHELGEAHAALRGAHERLKKQFVVSIKLFSNLLALRNEALAAHSRRVADLARRIGMRMGLEAAEVNDLVMAGLLHDLGKMAWPDELLSTPLNQMSAEQLTWVRKHPAMGQSALMALEAMAEPARLIRAHHERFDGTGYPDQLSGLNIPLGARILAVANDFDGLQNGTVNTVRLTQEEACAAIAQGKARRYDPHVVSVFLELMGGERKAVTAQDVELRTTQLKPGMTLARDLVSPQGVLLLAADYALNDSLIVQLREFEAVEAVKLRLRIRSDSIAPAP